MQASALRAKRPYPRRREASRRIVGCAQASAIGGTRPHVAITAQARICPAAADRRVALPDTGSHEAVPAQHARRRVKAGLDRFGLRHLLVASSATGTVFGLGDAATVEQK
jgi:hypothetical protein